MKRFQLLFLKMQFVGCLLPARFTFVSAFYNTKKIFLPVALFLCINVFAQNKVDTAYQNVIAQRSTKIVNTLGINKKRQSKKVQQILMNQYFAVNKIHDAYKITTTTITAGTLNIQEKKEAVKNETEKKSFQLKQLHTKFIAQLNKKLSVAQIEKVKDGITYKVLPVTWTAYKEMLPHLTQEQKDKMYTWLVEARELAMDEGSSDAKHAVFGKYKGRINNYLSAAGFDMKKEGEDWAKRIQAAKDAKQSQN